MSKPRTMALSDDNTAAARGSLPLVEGQDPPSEFPLFDAGDIATTKGALRWTARSAASWLSWYKGLRRKRLAADWEHDSLMPASERGPNGAPASAWWEPVIRDGVPWACNVKWTATAYEQLKRGEYAHQSPVVVFDPETREILAITKFALTNDPATIGQDQLIAASDPMIGAPDAAPAKGAPMKIDPKMVKAIVDAIEADYPDEAAAMAAVKQACADVFPPEPADKEKPIDEPAEDMEATAAKALRAEVATLTGKATSADIIGTVAALKEQAMRVEALSSEVATLRSEKTARAIDDAIHAAVTGGKLSPAERDDATKGPGKFLARCRANGDVEALSAFCDALGVRVSGGEVPQPKSADPLAMSEDDADMCRALGVDPAKVQANLRPVQ